MLTLWGGKRRFRDNVSRRDLLQIGTLGLGGLALPEILRLQAQEKSGKPPRAVIMVCLAGGPSHLDMYDLKPDAPTEIRGEFKPIKTNVPGFDICEHMPLQAKIADKLSLVRSLQFVEPMQHELEEVYSGFPKSQKRPSFGSVISKYRGGDGKSPNYVSLEYHEGVSSYENPQYIGAAHRPLHIVGSAAARNLGLLNGIDRARLNDRRGLMQNFDNVRRDLDASPEARDVDACTARAFDIISSNKTREACDLTRESDKTRKRYLCNNDRFIYVGNKADSRWRGENFLLARRLVEAGVPVVTLRAGEWDHHGSAIQSSNGVSIWHGLKTSLPLLDRSIHALVSDLHDRGLDKEVLVLIWGEFGRTPKISQAGRDHWPDVGFALFAGAVRTGQVIGVTDSHGARPKNGALGPQNVIGTVYHALGINYREKLNDFSGRPMQLLDDGEPIQELVT